MKKIYLFLTFFMGLWALNAQQTFFDPPVLEETLNLNDSAVLYTILHNYGEDTLVFDFPAYSNRNQGGPDAYGYTWIDSEEPNGPDWAWTEISETGTLVEGLQDDNIVGPFPMGFEFPYYGQEKSQFWINSNGCISFNDAVVSYANHPIPANNNYVDFIAWFWDDLTIDSGWTTVYYKTNEEQTIVQFNKMTHYPGTEEWITAQVVMRANGTILIRYKQIREAFPVDNATVGIQSYAPTMGLQVVFNEPYLHPELAIRFDLSRNFITSVVPASGFLPPGTQEHIWITYNSSGFEVGSYEQELQCQIHNPEYQEVWIHNVMHVVNAEQAGFKGYVTDAATGFALNDVLVKVGEQSTYTNNNGYYELPLEYGVYNVKFIKSGYQNLIVEDTTAMPGFSILDVELGTLGFIAGKVFAGENHIETGFAYLYKMLEGTVVDIDADMVGELGWFEFPALSAAQYIIKAEPSPTSAYYGLYLPTYYGDVLHWEDALAITVPPSTDDAHIQLIAATTAPQGPGSVSGMISLGDARSGAANIPVILQGADPGTALMTYSSSDGSFLFSGLPLGSYALFAEIPGKSTTPEEITLNETSASVTGVEMLITETQIIFLDSRVPEFLRSAPVIYPNPVNNQLNISLDFARPVMLMVSITDLTGKVLMSFNRNAASSETIRLDLTDLSRGFYFLRIRSGNDNYFQKFIKD